MYTGLSLLCFLLLSIFCGQSVGFWPFQIFTTTEAPEANAVDGGIKRVAIIGMHSVNSYVIHFSFNYLVLYTWNQSSI